MPGRVVQYQVKLAAMNLFERDILPLSEILDIVGFSESTFWRVRKLWRETGWVEKPKSSTSGRRRLLHRDDIDYILRLVNLRPDYFLDELLTMLEHNRFISVHFTTIFRELQRLGVSRKKLKKIAAERNERVRMDFVRRMAEYPAEYLGFLDETSKNERTLSRGYGRAKKGRRAKMKQKFVRGTRLTATGLLTLDGIIANKVVEGSMKREDYLEFIEHEVMPLTSPFPAPLSVLVMDNARIHHGEEILLLAERFGVRIEFLPPYSPDFNPIEEAFSKIKAFIRRHSDVLSASTGAALIYDMKLAMEIITPSDAEGYYMHAGYF
ncbi:Transposase domain-containing protein [Mycena venus]|uniref:Transposase domain-containing protein n=1 Tax=Mycena venus TaxID=2733690 RepID=A0A8H6X8U0_9AGAR|nr:Transposase domain-containing protein [Mycena venus]